jgi:hypothetical protein
MSDLPKLNPNKVVRFMGDRKSGVTTNGKTVYRSDKLWMGKEYGFVQCAQFSSHFIYHDPDFDQKTGNWPVDKYGRTPRQFVGKWTPMCSCGSPCAVYGANAYKQFASPTNRSESTTPGQMLMCIAVVNYGVHMDGSHD